MAMKSSQAQHGQPIQEISDPRGREMDISDHQQQLYGGEIDAT